VRGVRALIRGAAALVAFFGIAGEARAAPMARVGLLCPFTCSAGDVQVFRRELGRLGYAEGGRVR